MTVTTKLAAPKPTIAVGDHVTQQPPTFYDGTEVAGWPDPAWICRVIKEEIMFGVRYLTLEDRKGARHREVERKLWRVQKP
jgi:hypothetical protein